MLKSEVQLALLVSELTFQRTPQKWCNRQTDRQNERQTTRLQYASWLRPPRHNKLKYTATRLYCTHCCENTATNINENEQISQNPRRVAHCKVSSLVMVCKRSFAATNLLAIETALLTRRQQSADHKDKHTFFFISSNYFLQI